MATQSDYGKAFEYACLQAINDTYSPSQPVEIVDSPQFNTAQAKFDSLALAEKADLYSGALAAIRIIGKLEPQLFYHGDNVPLYLSIQADAAGIAGDVRDVLCLRKGNNWEMGISCKHNHEAVKHSRLSATIDFGKQWFGKKCNQSYFDAVTPLFNELKDIRDAGRAANKKNLWRDMPDKAERYYVPILNAFMEELRRLDKENPGEIPSLLIQYLIGRNDFYKVITDDTHRCTKVQVINLYGTLHVKSGKHKAMTSINLLKLPKRFFHIGFKPDSDNTIEVICDEGWNIAMRLHNASSEVEPSLKFDVKLEALPSSIYTEVAPW